jgi:hypothetical protein
VPEAVEGLREEAGGRVRVLRVEAVGVEFGEGGGGYYDARGVFGLEDVEGEVQGFAEGLVWSLDACIGGLGELLLTVVRRLSGGLAKVIR